MPRTSVVSVFELTVSVLVHVVGLSHWVVGGALCNMNLSLAMHRAHEY